MQNLHLEKWKGNNSSGFVASEYQDTHNAGLANKRTVG